MSSTSSSVVALAALLVLGASGCKNKTPAPDGRAPVTGKQPSAPVLEDASGPVATAVVIAADAGAVVVDAAPGDPDDLVDIKELDDRVAIDIRYATDNNFAKRAVYPVARCKLRRAIAERVVRANAALLEKGFALLLWDCYRPFHVQESFWKLVPDARYVARPVRTDGKPSKGSKHNRGAAVDVTITRADGSALELPTDYDDFSARAHRTGSRWTKAQRENATILSEALEAEGFVGIATEWWHFDGPGWRRYPLADDAL